MKSYVINKNDSGQRLDKFISKAVPKLPAGLMHKYIRTKRIKLNSKRCSAPMILSEGDILELYINDEFFGGAKSEEIIFKLPFPDIVYEDMNIIILNKPVNLPCHSGRSGGNDNLADRLKNYLFQKGEYIPQNESSFSPALCNRLDRNTCGMVIAAKNAETLRLVNECIRDGNVIKKYLCLVVGRPLKSNDITEAYHKKDSNDNKAEIISSQRDGYKKIITAYRFIKEKDGISLLEAELKTGRTHQIRAHFAYLGCPVLGDSKYGNSEKNKLYKIKYQALCAYSLKFCFENGSILEYLNGKSFEIRDIWFMSRYNF